MSEPERGADFDPAGVYRYLLWRRWEADGPRAVFVGLNPSTADGQHDDPTIRRCMGFARSWGCAQLDVVNLFAFKATRPADLRRAAAPIGLENDSTLLRVAAQADWLVACWGVHGAWGDRGSQVRALVPGPWTCLGRTRDGYPRHPLYLRLDTVLERY